MTLESTININKYIGNGATTVFPFTFKVWKPNQVAVYVGDGDEESDVTASCLITLSASGGSVTFRTAPKSGKKIAIKRRMPYVQQDDYRNGSRFDSEEIEGRLDQDCAERQDLKLEISRAIKVPITSDETPEDFLNRLREIYNYIVQTANNVASIIEEMDVMNCLLYVREGTLTGKGSVAPNAIIVGSKPVGFNKDIHNGTYSFGLGCFKSIDSEKRAGDLIAIGTGVMSEGHPSNLNIGIGSFALHNVDGEYSTYGDRNVAVGSLALFGLTTGRANVAVGRDAGQCVTTGGYNTFLGYGAMFGFAPVGLSGKIEVQNPLTGNYNISIGPFSGQIVSGSSANCVMIGYNTVTSAYNASAICTVGSRCLQYACRNTSFNGKILTKAAINGTYAQSGTTIEITMANHNAVEGRLVRIKFTSGGINDVTTEYQILTVASVISSTVFTITSPVSLYTSGNCVSEWFEQDDDSSELCREVVAIGTNAGLLVHSAQSSVCIGAYCATMAETGSSNSIETSILLGSFACQKSESIMTSTVIGYAACRDSQQIASSCIIGHYAALKGNVLDSVVVGCNAKRNADYDSYLKNSVILGADSCLGCTGSEINGAVCIGKKSAYAATAVGESTFVGKDAGNMPASLTQCTAVGSLAMWSLTADTAISMSTAIGYNAQVTGSNQVQLGTHTETTYVYGSVQDRSDERDKTDIRNTVLGLDFILSLRPVDFRWDYRDAYVDFVEREVANDDESGEATTKTFVDVVQVKKDGTRKRNRFHHGLIAQEVKAVLDEKGIDFGGYQDHKINGGEDVLTLGYEEFIAPIIKSIQEIDARLKNLEA